MGFYVYIFFLIDQMKKEYFPNKMRLCNLLFKFKHLPNTHRGSASGLATAICLTCFAIIILLLQTLKIDIPTFAYMIGFLSAEAIATVIFFLWANAAKKLKDEIN